MRKTKSVKNNNEAKKRIFFISDSQEKQTDFLECITPTQDILDVKQRKNRQDR